jgi:transposase
MAESDFKLSKLSLRCELTDHEWFAAKRLPANKPRGIPRVDDRRVAYGIFWALLS